MECVVITEIVTLNTGNDLNANLKGLFYIIQLYDLQHIVVYVPDRILYTWHLSTSTHI